MVKAMFLELGQADLRAIGRSRQFEPATVASRELMQHVFLSEAGVASAMASLTPEEVAGLHLLHCVGDQVGLEFLKRIYPSAVPPDRYASFNDRYRVLFQQIKTRLIQRGVLLFGTIPDTSLRGATVLERRRFRFPESFSALLPALFEARRLGATMTGRHRREVLRNKLGELLRLGSVASGEPAAGESGRWRLEDGRVLLGAGSEPFRVRQLEAWQRAQWEASVGYANKQQPEALCPVPLLLYALSRLREDEWLAPLDLLPLWRMALPGSKAPEPRAVCEAGYDWGCVERIELDGSAWYRLPHLADSEASTPPEVFLEVTHPHHVRIRLERTPLAALERLGEVSRLGFAEGALRATPDLRRLSHARAETLADPLVGWLCERHPAFRTTRERIEQRRGKLIVHEHLLVARISDLALKVMLEKRFGAPGQLVALSGEFVAFPTGLLPGLEAWMKKSGHVIKRIQSGEPPAADQEACDHE